MATDPAFAATVNAGVVQIGTADTSRTAPTNVGTVITAGSSGTRVYHVDITAAGTTTAGVVRLFIYDGSNYRLYREVIVPAITPSTSIAVFTYSIDFPYGLLLKNGWSLRATTHNSENFNVAGFGGDF